MDKPFDTRKNAFKQQFTQLLEAFIDAQNLITHKIRTDTEQAMNWQLMQDCLNHMKFFIDGEEIPTAKQKQKISLCTLLAEKNLTLDSNELACITKLDTLFNNLNEDKIAKTSP